jgi:hypothetical protein
VADEIPVIRSAVATLLRRLRDDHPEVPLRLLCSMAAGAARGGCRRGARHRQKRIQGMRW